MSKVDQAFAKLDADSSGSLKGSEITQLLKSSKALGRVRELFPALLDGEVTRDEFDQICKAIPEFPDAVLSA